MVVSVPYRGSSYFYKSMLDCYGKPVSSFRPLSGFFLFLQMEITDIEVLENLFPSPIGVLLISTNKERALHSSAKGKFPSPIGVLLISTFEVVEC